MAVTPAREIQGARRRAAVPVTSVQDLSSAPGAAYGALGPTSPHAEPDAARVPDVVAVPEVVEEEFARLAQRELAPSERALVSSLLQGCDLWASGFEPESIPLLAASLGAAELVAPLVDGPARPILFLSPEAELLRTRQVRFGARARTWLLDGESPFDREPRVDVEQGVFAEPAPAEPTEGEEPWALDAVVGGVVWCTLESLGDARVRKQLAARTFAAIFVESAHAASPMAYETRPSLALVPALRAACGGPPLVATSRAVPEAIRLDAAARLGLVEPRVHHVPLAAPTYLSVVTRAATRADERTLVELVERLPRPTIVYCDTPQEADAVFGQLEAAQVPVHRYHGAMSASERATEMLHFALPGRRAVMVATSAFQPGSGLAGIDAGGTATPEGLGLGYGKQRARSLLHLCVPASLEQYALELTVLGPEEETEAVLFVGPSDLRRAAARLELLRTTPEQVDAVTEALCASEPPVERGHVELSSGLGRKVVGRVLRLLADAGVLEAVPGSGAPGPGGPGPGGPGPGGLAVGLRVPTDALRQVASLVSSGLAQMQSEDARRLDAVAALLGTRECRKAFLEAYLGSRDVSPCGRCDVCRPAPRAKGSGSPAREKVAESEAAPVVQRRAPARVWSHTVSPAEFLHVSDSAEARPSGRSVRRRSIR